MRDAISTLIGLNEGIRKGTIFCNFSGKNDSRHLFRNVEHFGFDRGDVMFVDVTPDGDDTLTGTFVTRDGSYYTFDFDFDDLTYSSIIELSSEDGSKQAIPADVKKAAAQWFGPT